VPIPGTRTVTRLEENLGAARVALAEADLTRIDKIIPEGAVGVGYTSEHLPTWI